MNKVGFLDGSSVINNAGHWRVRGEEMRTLAEDAHDSTITAMMLRIAADYDRLAKWAEEQEKSARSEKAIANAYAAPKASAALPNIEIV